MSSEGYDCVIAAISAPAASSSPSKAANAPNIINKLSINPFLDTVEVTDSSSVRPTISSFSYRAATAMELSFGSTAIIFVLHAGLH